MRRNSPGRGNIPDEQADSANTQANDHQADFDVKYATVSGHLIASWDNPISLVTEEKLQGDDGEDNDGRCMRVQKTCNGGESQGGDVPSWKIIPPSMMLLPLQGEGVDISRVTARVRRRLTFGGFRSDR